MDNVLKIYDTRENVLNFTVAINGIAADTCQIKFVIEYEKFSLVFPCIKTDQENLYSVTISGINFLEKKAYPFKIEVVSENYYFCPFSGQVEITTEPNVSVSFNQPKPEATQVPAVQVQDITNVAAVEQVTEEVVKTPKPKKKPILTFSEALINPTEETVKKTALNSDLKKFLKTFTE